MKQCLAMLCCILFLSCSLNFSNSHKLYSGAPAKSESMGYVELGSAFMLTRADWFAEKLNIQYDSIYSYLEALTDSVAFNEIQKKWEASIVSKKERENFSKETLKMDKTVFIKTRLPEQGVEVLSSSGAIPNYLFIIHEYTIGGDLEAENFYDYTKANVEMSQTQTQTRKIKNLSIIATWTLWDNKKQIPLRSGIATAQFPIKDSILNMDIFVKTTEQAIAECIKQL